jgi:hypothetical protein
VIESIPQVKEVIGNQSSNVPTTNTLRNVSSTTPGGVTEANTKHTVDSNVNLNIKIDSNNPNIDTAQLALAFKDPQMIQAIYSIGKLDPNNNLTTNKTGSRTKQMLEGSYA